MKKIFLLIFCFLGLKGFSQGPVLTLPAGHTAHIASTIVSPDNKYLISSSDDNTTKIWEMASGKLLYNFPDKTAAGGPYMFNQFIFKSNGTELIALGRDVLMIFDFGKFKITKQVALKGFVSAALAANDRTLYISTRPENYKATIISMDLQDFSVKKLYTQSSADNYYFAIYRISLNKQQNKLLCFNGRQESALIDTAGNELEKFNTDVKMLCFLPNGEMMGIKELEKYSRNYTIRLINADTKQVSWETNITFQGTFTYEYNFQTIQFDKKSGQCLLASGEDFAVFDYINHTVPNLYPVPVGKARSMCFTPKPGVFIIGTQSFAEGGVKLYPINTNNNLAGDNFGDALMYVGSLKSSALASTILLGGIYKTFKQLSITRNGFRAHNLSFNKPGPFMTIPDLIGISPDGKTGVNATVNSVNLYNTEAPGEKYDAIDTPQTSSPQEIVFSNDGTLLATIGGAEVRIIDIKSKKVLKKIPTGDDYLFQGKTGTGAFSPDNKTFIAFSIRKGEPIGYMACFNVTTGAKLWERQGGDYSFNFSRDNAVVFCIDHYQNKAMWLNVSDGAPIKLKVFGDGKQISNAVVTSDLKYALLNVGSKIEIWDLATFTKTGELTGHPNNVSYSAFMSNEKYLISSSADNTIRIWDWKNQKELLKLVLFDDNEEWAAFTPDGRFDATPTMLKKMYYTQGKEIIPLEGLYEQFFTPLLINRVLNGERFAPLPVDINNLKRVPTVKMTYEAGQRNLVVSNDIPTFNNTTGVAEISVTATSPDDAIDEIRVFHNGKIVTLTSRNLIVTNDSKASTVTKKYTINLLPGQNNVRALALNTQRTESAPDELAVIYKGGNAAVAPAPVSTNAGGIIAAIDKNATLHLVVVGINAYKNPKMSLNYALADATAFKDEAERDAHTMITNVKTYFVTDDKADKSGILAALTEVQKNAKPQDVFVFYYAGHGVISEKNKEFYLVPNDVTDLKNVDEALELHGIPSKMLQQYAINIAAQKQVFILDACQSAGAFATLMTNDANRQKSFAVVARSTGTHWIAASGSQQFANEFAQLGHGAFTYVLLKAMKGEAASNNMVTINGLKNYLQVQVPDLMKKYNGTPQYPSSYGLGNDFPVEVMQ
ncbi:caspase family protein [Mucilaginibacter flavidus]|uniref:caspase family protein n=1 Tax=Mucilaginibacter flavidus TaxID=2949309 RepID=UPI002092FA42|nr:caspase family protein [Mucilaginibacter flavidus]MCO5946054.1 caspase family protein [Mucilaginibacter flavidus]